MVPITHPDIENISIEQILYALSDSTRLAIVHKLDCLGKSSCKTFENFGKKNNLSHHYKTLRENGIINVEVVGRQRFLSLRKDEIQNKFPSLIDTILMGYSSSIQEMLP